MGFMSLDIAGSDTASDFNANFGRELAKRDPATSTMSLISMLQEQAETDNGEWNTHGALNVALCLTEGHGQPFLEIHGDRIQPLLRSIYDEISKMYGKFRSGLQADARLREIQNELLYYVEVQ